MARQPIDSVRYFEFQYCWDRATAAAPAGRVLDVSSPRAFPLLLAAAHPGTVVDLLNPDAKDLAISKSLAAAWGVAERCRWHGRTVADADLEPSSFDLVTSISVVEHIADDSGALRAMWRLVRPGGRMLVTVPVAAEAFEEYMDIDDYGTSTVGADGWSFAWRCYDESLLRDRLFSAAGEPGDRAVFGERRAGHFFEMRRRKWTDPGYPTWREAYTMAVDYGRFPSIGVLPGLGIIGMEWRKPAPSDAGLAPGAGY